MCAFCFHVCFESFTAAQYILHTVVIRWCLLFLAGVIFTSWFLFDENCCSMTELPECTISLSEVGIKSLENWANAKVLALAEFSLSLLLYQQKMMENSWKVSAKLVKWAASKHSWQLQPCLYTPGIRLLQAGTYGLPILRSALSGDATAPRIDEAVFAFSPLGWWVGTGCDVSNCCRDVGRGGRPVVAAWSWLCPMSTSNEFMRGVLVLEAVSVPTIIAYFLAVDRVYFPDWLMDPSQQRP